MKTLTDHELSKIAEDWAKTMPVNTGIRTAFAAGFRHSENINKPKRMLMPRPGDYYESFEEGQRKSDIHGLTWHQKYERDLLKWKFTGSY